MTQDNRIWILLSRRLSGEASPAELEELAQLLAQSPNKQYSSDILQTWFNDKPTTERSDDEQERFQRIIARQEQEPLSQNHPKTKRLLYIASIAASLFAILFLGWTLYHQRSQAAKPIHISQKEVVLAKAGARTKLVLPDGTQVWLNSSSKLKYSNEFNKEEHREVNLEGEAYFDVAKDKQRPFVVHTSSLDIKVLGTAFTIKSYPQDETIETTLLQGAIEISRKDNPNTTRVILKPNEKLVFNKQTETTAHNPNRKISIQTAATPPDIAINTIPRDIPDSNKVETAWMYNRLVFKGDNFRQLTEKMERWYNVKITIKDTTLYNCHFGGAFANETLEEAFKALQLTTAFTYKIKGNEIELYTKR